SFNIPASCFFPTPEVDSACICLNRRKQSLLAAAERPTFNRIVKLTFSQRRKMMFKLLRTEWPTQKLEAAFAELSLPAQARAETVSLQQFVRLADFLSKDLRHG